jgi:hypothetical protein
MHILYFCHAFQWSYSIVTLSYHYLSLQDFENVLTNYLEQRWHSQLMKALVQAVYTGNIKTCTPTYEGKKNQDFYTLDK